MILDDDQVLIAKILAGKRAAFEELMKKYNKKIFGYIYRMVKDEDVAIELTQDFFLKLYHILDKYNSQYKFTTWAYRICYNMVIDHVRKNSAYIESLDCENVTSRMVESENYSKADALDNLVKEEIREYTWSVVDRIPPKFRELILMRYLQELKYDEIAEITQMPVGTVKNRLFKAKEMLKLELEKDGVLT